MDRKERFGMADRVISIGLWVNVALMLFKLLAGYFGNSEAVLADGLESACDLVAIVSTMIALKIGRLPQDEEHPYGHGKAESLAAILVSLVIFTAGAGILFRAVQTALTGAYLEPHLIAVLAAFSTIVIKEALFHYTSKVANKIGSPAVTAIAKDHRKDALTSIATLIGVGGAYLGASFMDPLAAALTAFFIFYIGWDTFRNAAHDLMDGRVCGDIVPEIIEIVGKMPEVKCLHEVRCRRSGQYLIVDLKLEMDPLMTVKQSHDTTVLLKKTLFDKWPNVGDVMIHINPYEPEKEHKDLIRL